MTKVTFKCKRSGNLISFSNENDIAGLRKHEGYVEIVDVEASKAVQTEPTKATSKEVLSLKRGRKPMGEIPAFLQE